MDLQGGGEGAGVSDGALDECGLVAVCGGGVCGVEGVLSVGESEDEGTGGKRDGDGAGWGGGEGEGVFVLGLEGEGEGEGGIGFRRGLDWSGYGTGYR